MPKQQAIRTFFAALIGVLLLRLVAAAPVVAATLGWIDGVFAEAGYAGISVIKGIEIVVTAAAILGYQKLAQALGDRWPDVEKWMLGSAARPHYEPRYAR